MRSRYVLPVLAGLLVAAPSTRASAQQKPDANSSDAPATEVDKLISDLGADDYQKRDEAQRKLVSLGKKAIPGLSRAEKDSKDAEVRARAHEAIAAIQKSGGDSAARERRGELEPDQPRIDEPPPDEERPVRPPRLGRDMDLDLPEPVKKMLDQIQRQFEQFDKQAERELRRGNGNGNGQFKIFQFGQRSKTPVEAKLGVTLESPSPAIRAQLDLPGTDAGLEVDELTPGGPAWKAGLKLYDVVTAVDGKPVRSANDLVGLGEREAKVDVIRKAKKETILVHPSGDAPAPQPRIEAQPKAPEEKKPEEPTRKF